MAVLSKIPKILRDCRGNTITVGSYVAYNQSGNVVEGEVVKILPKWKSVNWHPGFQWWGSFRVRNCVTNNISVVKNIESMMVI